MAIEVRDNVCKRAVLENQQATPPRRRRLDIGSDFLTKPSPGIADAFAAI
jgi:hypothetical protein